MRTRSSSVVVGFVALLGVPWVARAQGDHFTRLIQEALRNAAVPWEARGFTPTGVAHRGILLQGERESLVVTLVPESQYVALGACDEDCGNLNLHLLDADGKRVAVDVARDARPALTVSPPAAGDYRIEVAMVQCSAEPCYYGMSLLGRAAVGRAPP